MWTFVKNAAMHGVWCAMLSPDRMNKIIDQYSLRILDEYEAEYGRLPNDIELTMWRIGFIDGVTAIGEALFEQRIDIKPKK